MASIGQEGSTLAQALVLFLSHDKGRGAEEQQELNRFVRWAGRDRRLADLTPGEVEDYSQMVASGNNAEAGQRLAPVKAFLSFCQRRGLVQHSLAPSVRVRRLRSAPAPGGSAPVAQVSLTQGGYRELEQRLEALRHERLRLSREIQRAAADKDFRENAPLEAAREQQRLVASQILELEATLKAAVVVPEGQKAKVEERVRPGSRVALQDTVTGQEVVYLVVDPAEANPLEGKISLASPVGRALLGRSPGEEVRVEAPKGALVYRVLRVE